MARTTLQRLAVLHTLLADPDAKHYGLSIAKACGLATGTVYPILARMEADGLLTSEWEDVDAAEEGRPRRRHYALSGEGARCTVMNEVAAADRLARPTLRPRLAGA